MSTDTKLPFEASLERLQQIVRQLEGGELSLEDSLKSFEEGVRLTRGCQELLTQAEKKVELLMEASPTAGVVTQPFSAK